MSEELKPCPFCGHTELMLLKQWTGLHTDGGMGWAVVCDYLHGGCGSSGGVRGTEDEAREVWNRRAE